MGGNSMNDRLNESYEAVKINEIMLVLRRSRSLFTRARARAVQGCAIDGAIVRPCVCGSETLLL